MISLELTHSEAEALRRILCEHLSKIALEEGANGIAGFGELFKGDEQFVRKIVEQLQAQGVRHSADVTGEYSG